MLIVVSASTLHQLRPSGLHPNFTTKKFTIRWLPSHLISHWTLLNNFFITSTITTSAYTYNFWIFYNNDTTLHTVQNSIIDTPTVSYRTTSSALTTVWLHPWVTSPQSGRQSIALQWADPSLMTNRRERRWPDCLQSINLPFQAIIGNYFDFWPRQEQLRMWSGGEWGW